MGYVDYRVGIGWLTEPSYGNEARCSTIFEPFIRKILFFKVMSNSLLKFFFFLDQIV